MLEQHKLHHTPDGRWLLVAQRPHLLEVEHLAISVRDDAHKLGVCTIPNRIHAIGVHRLVT